MKGPRGLASEFRRRRCQTAKVSGRWSLLYFWDSPGFVRGYFAAFLASSALFVLGWRTRLTGALTWLLYVGMLRRGDAHWGGEQVYCGFLFLLMLARCGRRTASTTGCVDGGCGRAAC